VAHQHYKGTGKMHSFRGLLADGGQDKIRIEGATGEIAWRITKFQIIVNRPGDANGEHVVKIFTEKQTSITSTINFDDASLLAAASMGASDQSYYYGSSPVIIFDNVLFTRNIYITHVDSNASESCNYHMELEEVKVSAAGMAQLSVAAARRRA